MLRLGSDRIVLEQGSIVSDAGDLYVDCTAAGLRIVPGRPIFEPHRITLQQVRYCSPSFNAALVAYIESTRDDVAEQNRLCPANPHPNVALDWIRILGVTLRAANAWHAEPDLNDWLEHSRLNLARGIGNHAKDAGMQRALARYANNIRPAMKRLQQFLDSGLQTPV